MCIFQLDLIKPPVKLNVSLFNAASHYRLILSLPLLPFRLVTSSQTITPYCPHMDLYENNISTQIIRRNGNLSEELRWECYYYEIRQENIEAGRDIFVRYRIRGTGQWSTHFYRPFHPDAESLANLATLFEYSSVACWQAYSFSCSSPVMAINFRCRTNPVSLAGAWVSTIIPAKNIDRPSFNAGVVVLPLREKPACTVTDCLFCRSVQSYFLAGEFVALEHTQCRFIHNFENGPFHFGHVPIISRAYYGNIVALIKGNPMRVYLAVPLQMNGFQYETVAVRFGAFNLFLNPIPVQNCGHPLSSFFGSVVNDANAWISLYDESVLFFLREPLPPSLLHLARNLVLVDWHKRNTESFNPFGR